VCASSPVAALDAKLIELTGARDALRLLAAKCSDDQIGPCPILASFGI
jgi:MerR family transcriptional regulator, mercuric resistance operon regulatory protein